MKIRISIGFLGEWRSSEDAQRFLEFLATSVKVGYLGTPDITTLPAAGATVVQRTLHVLEDADTCR